MGRKTFDSLPQKKRPLPNRLNIVLTTKPPLSEQTPFPNVIYTNREQLLDILANLNSTTTKRKIFVIGGNEIYRLLFSFCSKIHMTIIYANIIGDTIFDYMPEYLLENNYVISDKSPRLYSVNSGLSFQYYTFLRKSK
jgi:dihydrofolate reductase